MRIKLKYSLYKPLPGVDKYDGEITKIAICGVKFTEKYRFLPPNTHLF
jgi:hypothetical protein